MPTSETALVFTVAGARLALRVKHVLEVLPNVALHHVPETPPVVAGFLALDGTLIPIVRLEQLLQLDLRSAQNWNPEGNLPNRIIVARVPGGLLGWIAAEGASIVRFAQSELVRLPSGHVLNSCAEQVIARTPPEPSIVLLEPERVLLEKERACIEEIRERMQERMAAFRITAGE